MPASMLHTWRAELSRSVRFQTLLLTGSHSIEIKFEVQDSGDDAPAAARHCLPLVRSSV